MRAATRFADAPTPLAVPSRYSVPFPARNSAGSNVSPNPGATAASTLGSAKHERDARMPAQELSRVRGSPVMIASSASPHPGTARGEECAQRGWLYQGEACRLAGGVSGLTLTQWRRAGMLPLTRHISKIVYLYARSDLERVMAAPKILGCLLRDGADPC